MKFIFHRAMLLLFLYEEISYVIGEYVCMYSEALCVCID